MADIRPELSKKSPYYIPKHRYYELKHFVMQYPEWKDMLDAIEGRSNTKLLLDWVKMNTIPNPVLKAVEMREYYNSNIEICERVAKQTDPVIGPYILKAIIDGSSYDILKARHNVPCCKDIWYDLYHKFFWLLDAARK